MHLIIIWYSIHRLRRSMAGFDSPPEFKLNQTNKMKKTLFSSWVDAQILKKAEDLKKLYGLEKQSELIRFLIVKEHREKIKK